MLKKASQRFIALVLIAFWLCLPFGQSYAAPTVKLTMNPNKTEFNVGDDPVALTVRASGANLEYTWKLTGPGKLEGKGPSVIYYIPKKISALSTQVMIDVTVNDGDDQIASKLVSFRILGKRETAEALEKSQSKSMSKATKVVLGVGALAAAGGAAALLAGGEDDGSTSFTGVFRTEFTKTCSDGVTPLHIVNTFDLQQDGNSITGTHQSVDTFGTCCTAGINVPVTGTVSGTRAVLTWPYEENTCVGNDCGPWTIYTEGGNYSAELVDGGKTLAIDSFGDLSKRTNRMNAYSKEGHDVLIRQ